MSTNTVQFSIGSEASLSPLFPFIKPQSTPKAYTSLLQHFIQLSLSQSLQRDGFYGAWPQVVGSPAEYKISITSFDPNADVTAYATAYPQFLAAVTVAATAYNAVPHPPAGVSFLPPFGLSMINTKSVQLLHYPPAVTLTYMDYLYSETNRRWESLLALNNSVGSQNTMMETITDLFPIAADGGGSGATAIQPWTGKFDAYVPQMLSVFLRGNGAGTSTQPIVAYGGEVLKYLETTYLPTDINPNTNNKVDPKTGKPVLSPLSLFVHAFTTDGSTTPVLCANHPAQFTYYPSESPQYPTNYQLVLQQDLICAAWQVAMSRNPQADPLLTLQNAEKQWAIVDPAIFNNQVLEFTYPTSQPKTRSDDDMLTRSLS